MKKTKKMHKDFFQWKKKENHRSENGSRQLKKYIDSLGLSVNDIEKKLHDIGLVMSRPTIYKIIKDPFLMNRYTVNAFAHALKIKETDFIMMISGDTELKVINEKRTIEFSLM